MSQESDIMVIVGGTSEFQYRQAAGCLCRANCPTVLVETGGRAVRLLSLIGAQAAGLTAGASTPADIIKEVLSTMSEIVNNNEVQEGRG